MTARLPARSLVATTKRPDEPDFDRVRGAREPSGYRPGITRGGRAVTIALAGFSYAGLGALLVMIDGGPVAHRMKDPSLKTFTVAMPRPPESEPPKPAPPSETPPMPQPVRRKPETLPTGPKLLVATLAPIAVAAAPSGPTTATTFAPAAPPVAQVATAPSAPAFVANPSCSIAQPVYPIRAKRLQQTGDVRVAVTIGPDGTITSPSVRKGSGYEALDAAAIATVRSGKCRANGDGRSINSVLTVAFTLNP